MRATLKTFTPFNGSRGRSLRPRARAAPARRREGERAGRGAGFASGRTPAASSAPRAQAIWCERLNLTPEQQRQLREIRVQGEPETRELTRRVRLARRALDEAIYSDAVEDALVEQRTRELAAAQAALMRLRATTELKVRRVLTVEQLQTFRELRRQAARRQLLQRRLRGARGHSPLPARPARRRRPAAAPLAPRHTPTCRRRATAKTSKKTVDSVKSRRRVSQIELRLRSGRGH